MLETIRQLRSALDRSRPVAYCRLVETRGSTPQKAGAMMLVYADGSQDGTLGGGCVEAEVKRRAISVLADGNAELATFHLDSDYGWDDGLICGGRMKILVEPLSGGASCEYFHALTELAESSEGITEAIVFDEKSAGRPAPASFLFDGQNRLQAVLHDDPAADASDICDQLKSLSSRPIPYALQGVAYLPLLPRCRLLIVGGGHVGKAVADLAYDLDFNVWITDDREEFVSADRFPRAQRRIAGPVRQVLPELEITVNTYCLIVTRGHNHDQTALYYLADRDARYVGLIGSRRKIRKIFEDLADEGIPASALAKVHTPVGIDIGSQSVSEIAVSIVAELVAHRNLDGQVPGRPETAFADIS